MITGSQLAKIQFEEETFLTPSRKDLKLRAYTQTELIEFMANIHNQMWKTTGKKKRVMLQLIIEDLSVIYKMTV